MARNGEMYTRNVMHKVLSVKERNGSNCNPRLIVSRSNVEPIYRSFRTSVDVIKSDYSVETNENTYTRESEVCCKESKYRTTDVSQEQPHAGRALLESAALRLFSGSGVTPEYYFTEVLNGGSEPTNVRTFMEYLGPDTFQRVFGTLTPTTEEALYATLVLRNKLERPPTSSEIHDILNTGSSKRGEKISDCLVYLKRLDLLESHQEGRSTVWTPTGRCYSRFRRLEDSDGKDPEIILAIDPTKRVLLRESPEHWEAHVLSLNKAHSAITTIERRATELIPNFREEGYPLRILTPDEIVKGLLSKIKGISRYNSELRGRTTRPTQTLQQILSDEFRILTNLLTLKEGKSGLEPNIESELRKSIYGWAGQGDANNENFFTQGENGTSRIRVVDFYNLLINLAVDTHVDFSLEAMLKQGVNPQQRNILLENAVDNTIQWNPAKKNYLGSSVELIIATRELIKSLTLAGAISCELLNYPHLIPTTVDKKRKERNRVSYLRHAGGAARNLSGRIDNIEGLVEKLDLVINDSDFMDGFNESSAEPFVLSKS